MTAASSSSGFFERAKKGLFFVLLGLLLLAGFSTISDIGLVSDEGVHFEQIELFFLGKAQLHPLLTTIPGYHLVLASLAKFSGMFGPNQLRFISLLLASTLLIASWKLSFRLHQGPVIAKVRTLQVASLPLVFIFLPLLYTDLLSLSCVVFAILYTQSQRYRTAAVFAIAAVLFRQSNVVWLAMCMAMLCAFEYQRGEYAKTILAWLSKGWLFVLGGLVFIAFVIWNGGVALGDRAMHPPTTLRLENVFASIITLGFLLLPLCLARVGQTWQKIRQQPLWGVLGVLVAALFYFGFSVSHPYNLDRSDYYLHNSALALLNEWPWRWLAALAIAWLVPTLAAWPLRGRFAFLIFPAAFLSLLPMWLIEPRYHLVPIVLLLILREPENDAFEIMQLLWSAALLIPILFCTISVTCFI